MSNKRQEIYEALGAEKRDDQETIKRKYRRRARETHPDAGGDPEEFKAVARAFEILGDEQRRLEYDRTGDDRPQIDRGDEPAYTILTGKLRAFIVADMKFMKATKRRRLIADMRASIAEDINRYENELVVVIAERDTIAHLVGRFTRPDGGSNVLEQAVCETLKDLEAAVDGKQRQLAAYKRAHDLARKFKFQREEDSRPSGELTATPTFVAFKY